MIKPMKCKSLAQGDTFRALGALSPRWPRYASHRASGHRRRHSRSYRHSIVGWNSDRHGDRLRDAFVCTIIGMIGLISYSSWSESRIDVGAAGRLKDHGDIQFDGTLDPWDLIEQRVGQPMESGDPLICLGGDHAITHPIMRAVRRRHPNLTILHIDAHPDIYHEYQGNPRSRTSPFARIMEERLADRLIQVGLRTVNDHHREQFKRFGVEIVEAGRYARPLALDLNTPVYISMDIDALDPAYAPRFGAMTGAKCD
jgi:Arginase family